MAAHDDPADARRPPADDEPPDSPDASDAGADDAEEGGAEGQDAYSSPTVVRKVPAEVLNRVKQAQRAAPIPTPIAIATPLASPTPIAMPKIDPASLPKLTQSNVDAGWETSSDEGAGVEPTGKHKRASAGRIDAESLEVTADVTADAARVTKEAAQKGGADAPTSGPKLEGAPSSSGKGDGPTSSARGREPPPHSGAIGKAVASSSGPPRPATAPEPPETPHAAGHHEGGLPSMAEEDAEYDDPTFVGAADAVTLARARASAGDPPPAPKHPTPSARATPSFPPSKALARGTASSSGTPAAAATGAGDETDDGPLTSPLAPSPRNMIAGFPRNAFLAAVGGLVLCLVALLILALR